MTFLKSADILLKKAMVMVQFLHMLVLVLQLCGTKLQCFYSILTVVMITDFTILMEK